MFIFKTPNLNFDFVLTVPGGSISGDSVKYSKTSAGKLIAIKHNDILTFYVLRASGLEFLTDMQIADNLESLGFSGGKGIIITSRKVYSLDLTSLNIIELNNSGLPTDLSGFAVLNGGEEIQIISPTSEGVIGIPRLYGFQNNVWNGKNLFDIEGE
jgi:hypothetical protein